MRSWWAAVISMGVCLSGCMEHGSKVRADQAEDHFQRHKADYERIVTLVASCRPERRGADAGYNRVWADGSTGEKLYCQRDGQSTNAIMRALQGADAVSVSYLTSDGPGVSSGASELRSVSIGVYSAGIVPSGTSIDFVYVAQALESPPQNEIGDGYGVERRLVGGSPRHWYLERSWN